MNELMLARQERDRLRGVALYGPRNTAQPWGDEYARWCCAHPKDRAAYDAAVAAVRAAARGTRYAGTNPEYL
jgi:hypothetical protein